MQNRRTMLLHPSHKTTDVLIDRSLPSSASSGFPSRPRHTGAAALTIWLVVRIYLNEWGSMDKYKLYTYVHVCRIIDSSVDLVFIRIVLPRSSTSKANNSDNSVIRASTFPHCSLLWHSTLQFSKCVRNVGTWVCPILCVFLLAEG